MLSTNCDLRGDHEFAHATDFLLVTSTESDFGVPRLLKYTLNVVFNMSIALQSKDSGYAMFEQALAACHMLGTVVMLRLQTINTWYQFPTTRKYTPTSTLVLADCIRRG